jgi:hypothetical protein
MRHLHQSIWHIFQDYCYKYNDLYLWVGFVVMSWLIFYSWLND